MDARPVIIMKHFRGRAAALVELLFLGSIWIPPIPILLQLVLVVMALLVLIVVEMVVHRHLPIYFQHQEAKEEAKLLYLIQRAVLEELHLREI
ncbi:hypothetical protein CJ307_28850 [Klebsiella quasipneumoniae]|nr:hypothetical protein CJ307_28850 [Klebsiella quasipneumoniae]